MEGYGVPADYPELARVAWNRDPCRAISGEEALGRYEANWRHVEVASLSPRERMLINALAARFGGALAARFGGGHFLITK